MVSSKRRVLCAFLWAVGMLYGQSDTEPEGLLARITHRTRETLSGLPNYVCTETIQRSRRASPNAPLQPLDTLRVEVGLVGNRELYSWPDAARFEEKQLSEMIGWGMVGTGNFALLAKHIFLVRVARFTWRGVEAVSGRRLLRYDYEVPRDRSSYTLRVHPNQAAVGFGGSFWVEPDTLDLVRLDVRAADIPESLGLAEASTIVHYARRPMGDSSFLLPASSEMRMLAASGDDFHSQAQFSACRRYVSESSLSFSEPSAAPSNPAPGAEARPQPLPARLSMELSLDEDVDPETAAAGAPVRAVLARPLKDGDAVIAPAGARVLGRLLRVEKQTLPFAYYVVALQFHTLEAGDRKSSFTATMENAGPASGLIHQAKRLDPKFTRQRSNKMEILVQEQHAGQGVIHWDAKHARIPRGLKMRWRIDHGE